MIYKTPGVYVEEISLLPPSVAQVETAIPAFIGYTEKAQDEHGDSLINVPKRITSLLEYTTYYGKGHNQNIKINLSDSTPYSPVSAEFESTESPYRMYSSMQMYFANGGGPCFVTSVGDYDAATTTPSLDTIDDYKELKAGLDAVRKIDEVTLIVIPDADRLNSNGFYDIYKDVLMQCSELKDRFGIFDVLSTDTDGSDFRDNIGTNHLSYGAAYYPYLNSSLIYPYTDETVAFSHGATDAFNGLTLAKLKSVSAALNHMTQTTSAKQQASAAEASATPPAITKEMKIPFFRAALSAAEKGLRNAKDTFDLVEDDAFTSTELTNAETKLNAVKASNITISNTIAEILAAFASLTDSCTDSEAAATAILAKVNSETGVAAARNANINTYFTNAFLGDVTTLLNDFRITLPPASVMAGIYARVDSARGVWKAPANESVNMVSGPSVKIDISANDSFNVHPTGKSINVIRAFTGKGTLVWGARTLDGNSGEWKYVPVRRFFNMVEESVKKASEQFVFEPNDANTWVKVKAMIENFLILQWRTGALMGSKPEEAFFVKTGLGETMTQDDVLNGRMIVEIGLAMVRPAEFIILRFSHKMLEA
jgi:phage tail sheath protein FI